VIFKKFYQVSSEFRPLKSKPMADTDKDALLAQFQDVTGSDSDRAGFFLESSNWDLDVAVGSFFESGGEMAMDQAAPPAQPAAEAAAEPPKSAARPPPASRGGIGPNVAGINRSGGEGMEDDDDGEEGEESSDDENSGQAFYAGGSSTSGQQILGPPKKKTGAGFVKDVFKKAREAGAESVEPGTSSGKKQSGAFTGSGFKLGSSETAPSQKIEGAKKAKPPREFVLKMWRNGFSIDDGDLRPYNDPANRAFLSAVMKGAIPDELVHAAEGGEVHVDMEDHKEEEFVKPKGVRKAFTGAGNVLGGIAPGVTAASGASATSAGPPPADPAAAEKAAQSSLGLEDSAPSTSVQVRLPDGKRIVAKLNQERHTVGDLRRFVSQARPDYAAAFSLHTTFPPKELTDDSATIKDAGLVGAAVLLRLK